VRKVNDESWRVYGVKKVIAVKGARTCNHPNGCGRTIRQGEECYVQKRTRSKKQKVRYMCKECYDRKVR